MKIENMLGYKIFKEDNDELTMYRIIKMRKPVSGGSPSEVTVIDEFTKEEKKVRVEDLKGFTPLEPDAYLTFNAVHVLTGDKPALDVVVTGSKLLNLKIGDTLPYVICRQSVTDIFYNLICTQESDMIAGISINQDTCPTNFHFENFLACDGIDKSEYFNYYRTDTVEDILPYIKTNRFNEILNKNYMEHCKFKKDTSLAFKKQDGGWCKDLETLLKENAFQSDIDQMLGIIAVDFDLKDYIVNKPLISGKGEYESLNEELSIWLGATCRVVINDTTVIKYDYDIDLSDFNNTRYVIIRDKNKDVYVIAYTTGDQKLLQDLEEKAQQLDLSDKFRLEFYNKYNKDHNADK